MMWPTVGLGGSIGEVFMTSVPIIGLGGMAEKRSRDRECVHKRNEKHKGDEEAVGAKKEIERSQINSHPLIDRSINQSIDEWISRKSSRDK